MTELHQATKDELSRAVYRLNREQENGNFSPIFLVIEKAIEMAKKGMSFDSPSDTLAAIALEIAYDLDD